LKGTYVTNSKHRAFVMRKANSIFA
jgi:hypothetical protein